MQIATRDEAVCKVAVPALPVDERAPGKIRVLDDDLRRFQKPCKDGHDSLSRLPVGASEYPHELAENDRVDRALFTTI